MRGPTLSSMLHNPIRRAERSSGSTRLCVQSATHGEATCQFNHRVGACRLVLAFKVERPLARL